MSAKRNLLVCLDAFGTIFTPEKPIAAQYGGVARSFGIAIDDEQVMKGFKKAFKEESKAHPNYGKAVGLGATKWWTNVITQTFQPYHPHPLPPSLAPTLIDRFNCKDGYRIYPDVAAYLGHLSTTSRHRKPGSDRRVVIGIVTNSDDRVPDVLRSLGLRVGRLRHGVSIASSSPPIQDGVERGGGPPVDAQDVDFAIVSYDVGFEKPARQIFDAATDMLRDILVAESQQQQQQERQDVDLERDWDLVYIGDEMDKDGRGATEAGWHAVIVDREDSSPSAAAAAAAAAGEEKLPGLSYKTLVGGKEVDVISDFSALKNLKTQFPLIMG